MSPKDGLQLDAVVDVGELHLELAAEVGPGEVLGVLGPNGAGKTTLLRILAGLMRLRRGRIAVAGEVWDEPAAARFRPPESRPVGMVFQDYRLFPHLDVRDNVAFAPRSRGARRAASRSAAQQWLETLDLTALASRRPHQLSGGQAQRVALARALAGDPRLLLLDEPLAALDARTRTEARALLRRHLARFEGPVLIVTHDPLEAMVMTDRLLVLEGGRVVQHGAPADIARRPATQYVARLVGLNLYAGRMERSTGVVALDAGGTLAVAGPEAWTTELTPELPLDGRVLVALSPASITLSVTRPERASARNVWAGTVRGLELLTDRVRVQVDGAPPALVDITAAAVADLGLELGHRVWLSAKATETTAYGEGAPLR